MNATLFQEPPAGQRSRTHAGLASREFAESVHARRFAMLLVLSLIVADVAWPADGLARTGVSAHERHQKKRHQTGYASFYGRESRNRVTANGERFDPSKLTAAHRTLPFGTRVRVTNLDNGRRVVVRINDRGPYAKGRVLDLSRAAARELGFVHDGVAHVRLEVLKGHHPRRERMAGEVASPPRAPGVTSKSPKPTTRKAPPARA